MAPQSKKRKEHPQSTTLLDFFSPDAVTAKKGKTIRKKSQQRTAARPIDQVIVIDSDGDGHVPVSRQAKGKKRSREVEVIDEPAAAEPSIHLNRLVTRSSFGAGNSDVVNPEISILEDVHTLFFGEPVQSDVAQASSESFTRLNNIPSHPGSSPSTLFGAPPSLLRDIHETSLSKSHNNISAVGQSSPAYVHFGTKNDAGPSRPSVHPIQETTSSSSNFTDSSFRAFTDDDDDWVMGDDEMALVDPEPDEENIDEIEINSSPLGISSSQDESLTTCPICALHLVGLFTAEVQDHVNKCIDTLSPPPPQPPRAQSSTPQPLPLSSIQTLHRRGKTPLTDTNKTLSWPNGGNAFSVLMSSHKENEAWKEATVVEDRNFRPNKENGGRRKAPFYKVLQGMPIAVDAFRYQTIPGVTAYFLTHAHSDHYTNLASNWKSGPIYCSQSTSNLIIHMLSVDPKWVHPLPMDIPSVIPNTGGVQVTLIEANHCPGSCLFFFEGPQTTNAGDSVYKSPFIGSTRTFRYLHCGDFRASPRHALHPSVKGKWIDHIYLDTTYLDPKYTFPPQPHVISACAELAKRIVSGQSTTDNVGPKRRTLDSFMGQENKQSEKKDEKILIVVGTYSIGKERIVKAIAKALNTQVYCDIRKAAILRCQSDPELHGLLTSDPLSAGVHLVPLNIITSDRLKTYMDRFEGNYTRAIGFRPTGWTHASSTGSNLSPSIPSILSHAASRPLFTYSSLHPSPNSTSTLTLYGVPYSEHSSFFELTCFAMSLEWGKMIATVNVGSANSRAKMGRWIDKWQEEGKKGKTEVVKYRELDYW